MNDGWTNLSCPISVKIGIADQLEGAPFRHDSRALSPTAGFSKSLTLPSPAKSLFDIAEPLTERQAAECGVTTGLAKC